jgi:hypothetical protein
MSNGAYSIRQLPVWSQKLFDVDQRDVLEGERTARIGESDEDKREFDGLLKQCS